MQRVSQKLKRYNHYHVIKHALEAAIYDLLRADEFEIAWKEMVKIHGLARILG